MAYVVYMHIAPNGKKYVGITKTSPQKRWNSGKGYMSQQLFYRAIQKYGWENFTHAILADNLDETDAKNMEVQLIDKYQLTNVNFGYNVSPGGDTGNGLCGKTHPMYGKHLSDETRRKISEATLGRKPWNYGIYGMESSFKGKHHTESAKKKLSEKASLRTAGKNPHARSVICTTTKEVFPTATEAAKKYHCNQSNITYCILGRQHYACKLSDGTELHWEYAKTNQ